LKLEAEIYEAFGGVLDFSEDSNIGKAGKLALKTAAFGLQKEQGIEVDTSARNDYRDWDKIRSFAENFYNIL
jgi:hypothetical protein